MELYFTRHGKTKWNEERRFQGYEGDSPLLEESYKEIELLGQRLSSIPFERVYSSSAKRAQDTAEGIIAQLVHPAELVVTDDLREIYMGNIEGVPVVTAKKAFGKTIDEMRRAPELYDPTPFKGETLPSVIARNTKVVTDAVERAQSGPLLFVGHGISLTAAIQTLAGKQLADIRKMGGLANSSLSILDTQDKDSLPYELILWDDTQHLTN